MKPNLLLPAGALVTLLGLIILGSADTARAQTFNPVLEITVANPEAGANSDYTANFSLPAPDVNFAAVVAFIPAQADITLADEIPIGAVIGELTATATLGLINNACSGPLPVKFTMLNASIDPTDTVIYLDTQEDDPSAEGFGLPDYFEDVDKSGLQDGIEKYPDFITRVLDDKPGDEVGQPLKPLRRSAGITQVAGVNVLLQFLIFEPGTFINENIPNDADLGYPSVTLLQNVGDPATDPIPSPITDFCTPLTSSNTTFGVTKDNTCTDAPGTTLDAICEVRSVVADADQGGTEPDESGIPLFTNPEEGTYTFTIIAAGLRDADGDGYENNLDTCAFDPNIGDPRVQGDGDDDTDGLDAACDPNPTVTNSDEDLDGYPNRGDNCPLKENGEFEDNQRDTDDDLVGDACDPDPDNADAQGELTIAEVSQDVTIGPGGPPGETPVADETPTDGSDEDGGGGGGTIIIVVAVIAAVVVLGGGGYYFIRRRGA